MFTNRVWKFCKTPLALCALSTLSLSGCATTGRQLEKVAKDWCQTIRASQVMCSYPLTEDIRPGDVFLVQTGLAEEQNQYKKRGFLPLSDHRKRLLPTGTAYQDFYADSYWKDEFGAGIPNARPKRPDAAALAAPNPTLTEVNAPRAVFPSYTFEVQNQSGLALAVPIQGIPVGLNYMQADKARGSMVIGDARSYGLDSTQVYEMLRNWLETDAHAQDVVRGTVKQIDAPYVLLRVITRVYMTGGMTVSLTRADTKGAEVKAGNAPAVSLVDANGNIDQNVSKTLTALEDKINLQALDVGGRVKFLSASSSAVSLAESFDRMLVVGYLAVDVPYFKGGCLGYPLPTYERLENRTLGQPVLPAGVLLPQQKQFQVNFKALEERARNDPDQAIAVVEQVMKALGGKGFKDTECAIAQYRSKAEADRNIAKDVLPQFQLDSGLYAESGGACGERHDRFATALVGALAP